MFLVNRSKKSKTCLPFVLSRLALALIGLSFFFSSPALAQCTLPLLNNAISLKPAVCTATVGYLQGTTPVGGNGTTYTYQWQSSATGCAGVYATIAGATGADYMIPSTDPVGLCYRRVVTSGTNCTSNSNGVLVNAADRTTPAAPTTTFLQPTCVLNTGTITVTSPAPASGITYSVNGTTYTNTTGIFALLPPGTYSVTAKFSTGCVSPALPVTLNSPSFSGTVSPATATICTNGSQVLTATAGSTLYQWYQGNTLVAATTVNTYTVPGTQAGTYYAIITNGLCATQTNNATINAVAPPSGSITPAGPITICAGNSTTLTATGGGTYQWYRDGNLVSNTTPTLTTNLGGTYSVILNNGVCSTQIANTVQVNVQAMPTGTISPGGSASICSGSSQPLSVSGGASYQWYLNGLVLSGDTSSTYSASQAGIYTVDIISSSGCKAKATNSSTITVTPLPSGSIAPASVTLCSNDSVTLTATGGVSYQWYIDGQSQSGFFASTFNAKIPGRYAVEIFDTRGCKGKSSNESIVTLSTLQTSVITTNITCTQSSGTVTVTGSGGTGPYQYKLDAGGYSSASTFTVSAGNHKVTVKDAAGCTSETAFTIIQVQSTLAATSSIINASCGLPNGVITIQPTGGTGPYTFSLNSGNFQNTNSFSSMAVGVYKVTVKDGVGCTYEVSAEVKQLVGVPNLVVTNPAKICPGTTADLKASAITAGSDAGLSFTYWKDATASSALANPSSVTEGTYYIRAANSGCSSIKPVVVTMQTVFPGSITFTRITACITDSLPLTASGGVSYQWYRNDTLITGANKATYQAKQSGIYSVFISDGTCSVKASNTVQIEFKACTPIFDPRIFVPTGFTPNRNGTNDVLRPIFYNIATLHYFKVYNRWGQQVFETSTAGKGWDGTKEGIPQPPETYSWILECVGKNGEIIKQSGRSALIR